MLEFIAFNDDSDITSICFCQLEINVIQGCILFDRAWGRSPMITMKKMKACAFHKVEFWRRRILPYPCKFWYLNKSSEQSFMCTRKCLRRLKEMVEAKVRLPSRNDINCVVFYIFRHDEKFLRHARYPNVLTNGEIPESRVLSNSFPCNFVDDCPRFGLNVRCWKESSESNI